MTRELFARRLRELQSDTLVLASMVEKAIDASVESLRTHDVSLAQRVVDDDSAINRLRYKIEEDTVHTIATQQPMAADLRELVAILFLASELERIGDHAEGIGRITLMMKGPAPTELLFQIPDMAHTARDMLHRAIDVFIERDAERARALVDEDDVLDRMYHDTNEKLIRHMIRNPDDVECGTYLMWTCHNLERIGDRVTNICERVIFVATGELQEINVSRY